MVLAPRWHEIHEALQVVTLCDFTEKVPRVVRSADAVESGVWLRGVGWLWLNRDRIADRCGKRSFMKGWW